MVTELSPFKQEVDQDGYKIISAWELKRLDKAEGNYYANEMQKLYITNGKTINEKSTKGEIVKRYNPLMEKPTLFKEFAEIETTEKGILSFVNQYGLLDGGLTSYIDLSGKDQMQDFSFREYFKIAGHGEWFEDWKREIEDMKKAITIWDHAENNHIEELSKVISFHDDIVMWTENGDYAPIHTGETSDMIAWEFDETWPALQNEKDVILAAKLYVEKILNDHLDRAQTRVKLINFKLSYAPSSLRAVLWGQFAQAINQGKTYRQCDGCHKWIELSPDIARSNKYHCNQSCKNRAYRRRKKQAYEWYLEGMSLEEIAKKMESDLETIQKWIDKEGK